MACFMFLWSTDTTLKRISKFQLGQFHANCSLGKVRHSVPPCPLLFSQIGFYMKQIKQYMIDLYKVSPFINGLLIAKFVI